MDSLSKTQILLLATPLILLVGVRVLLNLLGQYLRGASQERRELLRAQFKRDRDPSPNDDTEEADNGWEKVSAPPIQSSHEGWEGIIGFFHPFCNAGGGGERVLWAAIAAIQQRYPSAICCVYTGDHEIEQATLISTVQSRFNITLQSHSLQFIFLTRRPWVLASKWPYFTLLGQSLGSMFLAYEAFSLLVPDIYIDTMGYAFTTALSHWLFPKVPRAAYVHYPTISTDMLQSLDDKTGTQGINAGAGAGLRGQAKKLYWQIFAYLYAVVGRQTDIVMCNSTWTLNHISTLWKPKQPVLVYPPCPVDEIASKISLFNESARKPIILYVAQYRPEKNHGLVLRAFARFYQSHSHLNPELVLIGSVRANTPDEKHIYNLRLQARELKIDHVTKFITDAPFSTILEYLGKSTIGVNGMYAEHFGIGNVEGLAAGLIPVANDSGGPKLDIVVPFEGKEIGYLASTEEEYAQAFGKVFDLDDKERLDMRKRCRESSKRFSGDVFEEKWLYQMQLLVDMQRRRARK